MKETKENITLSTQTEDASLTHHTDPVTHINTHFVLAVVAIILSCFTGFFTVPLAIAALIFSLRTQDLLMQEKWDAAQQTAFWAGLFGWITVAIAILPILLFIFFGGAILAALGALLAAA